MCPFNIVLKISIPISTFFAFTISFKYWFFADKLLKVMLGDLKLILESISE